jgi:hypothetical protein
MRVRDTLTERLEVARLMVCLDVGPFGPCTSFVLEMARAEGGRSSLAMMSPVNLTSISPT